MSILSSNEKVACKAQIKHYLKHCVQFDPSDFEDEDENQFDLGNEPVFFDYDQQEEKNNSDGDEIKKRPCEICGAASGEEDFILCENTACKNGGHLQCYELEQLPLGQWFCSGCLATEDCYICRQVLPGQPLVSCEWCERIGHAACLDLMDPPETGWRCKECRCVVCGIFDDSTLWQCKLCHLFVHTKCVSNLAEQHIFEYLCPFCQCKQKEDSSEDVNNFDMDDHVSEASENVPNADDDPTAGLNHDLEEIINSIFDEAEEFALNRSSYASNLNRLSLLKERMPAIFLFLKWSVTKKAAFDKEDWIDFVRTLEKLVPGFDSSRLRSQKPPQKLGRLIRQLVPDDLRTPVVVSVERGELTFEADFLRRDLKEVIQQLLYSPCNRDGIPLYEIKPSEANKTSILVSTPDCGAMSRWGPRLNSLHEGFIKYSKANPSTDLILPLQFYSDGTSSNFLNLHPICVSIFNFDRLGRILNGKTAQVTYGMAPVASSLRIFKGKGAQRTRITLGQAKKLITDLTTRSILREMLRSCVRVVMEDLSDLEKGADIWYQNKIRKLHCYLYSWICDMEERRDILDLSLSQHWVCTHCFARPTPNSIPCEDERLEVLISEGLPRSHDNIQKIHRFIRNPDSDATKDYIEARFGMKFPSNCPLSPERNFLLGGAADYFLFDRLHVLDGVSLRLWKMLRSIYGPSLEEITQALGNRSLGVAVDIRFHKMEDSLHDFQYLLLALINEEGLRRSTRWRHGMTRIAQHRNMAFAFQQIVYIVKDDAPGLCLNILDNAAKTFGTAYASVEKDVKELNINCEEPSKVHVVINHIAPQTEENGPSAAFSSDIGEFTHPEHKRLVHLGSMRYSDQGPSVLRGMLYRSLFADLYHQEGEDKTVGNKSEDFSVTEPYMPAVRFQLQSAPKATLKQGADKALSNVLLDLMKWLHPNVDEAFLVKKRDSLSQSAKLQNVSEFGYGVKCSLYCKKRDIPMKTDLILSSFSTKNAQSMRVIAYHSGGQGEERCKRPKMQPCDFAWCRHHNPDIHLHCSYSRLIENTSFGIPLLFVEAGGVNRVVVLPLTQKKSDYKDVVFAAGTSSTSLMVVDLQLIKTSCLSVHYNEQLYVFVASERAFRHL